MPHLWIGDQVRIGSDLDGVGYNFTKAFCEAAMREGYDLPSEPDSWNWFEPHGMTRDTFTKIMHDSVDDLQLFWRGEMLDDFARHIRDLQRAGHSIHIVTHRVSGNIFTSEQATRYWLDGKDIQPDSLTFSADKTVVPVDTFIEDNLDNYDALESAGHRPYLVNRTYNQQQDNRRRVDSFGDFAAFWI